MADGKVGVFQGAQLQLPIAQPQAVYNNVYGTTNYHYLIISCLASNQIRK